MLSVQKNNKFILLAFLVIIVSISCRGSAVSEANNAPTNTNIPSSPTPDLAATAEYEAQERETEQAQIKATEEYLETEAAIQTAAAEEIAQVTKQAQPMYDLVQDLYQNSYLSDPQGTYYRIDDFSESHAAATDFTASGVTRNYVYYYTGYSPRNFVIRADLAWENYAEDSNQFGGCGFVFWTDFASDDPDLEHGLVWLSGAGRIHFSSFYNERYGSVGWPNGEAEITLVVDDYVASVFVNGEYVAENFANPNWTASDLAISIMSGDSRDFGTRCTMTNIDLWDMTSPGD